MADKIYFSKLVRYIVMRSIVWLTAWVWDYIDSSKYIVSCFNYNPNSIKFRVRPSIFSQIIMLIFVLKHRQNFENCIQNQLKGIFTYIW